MAWKKFDEKMPKDGKQFLAVDDEGKYHVRTTNTIHKLADTDGIFTPAMYGQGARLIGWMWIPKLPDDWKKT